MVKVIELTQNGMETFINTTTCVEMILSKNKRLISGISETWSDILGWLIFCWSDKMSGGNGFWSGNVRCPTVISSPAYASASVPLWCPCGLNPHDNCRAALLSASRWSVLTDRG